MATLKSSTVVLTLVAVAIIMTSLAPLVAGQLKVGFYSQTCPQAESLVFNEIQTFYNNDKTTAPGVLRLTFHDCFVRGCDGSVLLNNADGEKTSIINANLHGFDAIDAAKAAVEKACPNTVSCADIVQFAGRDAVILTGGQGWNVPAGRRDGTVSIGSEVINNMPASEFEVPKLITFFAAKGLSATQMAVLSGGHTIGIGHCQFITDRIYTFNSSNGVDPSIPASFAASLLKQCPSSSSTNALYLDLVSPGLFDHQYYTNIINKLGLFTSDQSLLDYSQTESTVFANNGNSFYYNFGQAMIAMSSISPLTGTEGQIRAVCGSVN